MSDGIPAMWMRGGTSKGGYFRAEDLPRDAAARDALLLRIMGSPDARQIDGLGGASPLTSKVAVIGKSDAPGVDVDYLFLQVFVDRPLVSDAQTCGNILAGVGPFAIERGLVTAQDGETSVTIRNTNTGQIVRAVIATPRRVVRYDGGQGIDGVPGTAAPIPLFFSGIAGAQCGALLPTGQAVDQVEGTPATLIDNGMPAIIMAAADFGLTGDEPPDALEANTGLRKRLERIRLAAGPRMILGDVAEKSVPKLVLVSASTTGAAIRTRCFIPHSCHRTIGVLCAVSVVTACLLPGSPAHAVANVLEGQTMTLAVEHPTGRMPVTLVRDQEGRVTEAGMTSTARKLFDGRVFP